MPQSFPKAVFDHWTEFEALLRSKAHLILLCDFDGTLAAIQPRPEQAFLPKRTLEHLKRLRTLRAVTLGVVSGRSLANIRRQVPLRTLWFIGNHGAEIRGPKLRFVHPEIEAAVPVLREIARELKAALASFDGGRVESKDFSLSIHWREVHKRKQQAFLENLEAVLRPHVASKEVKVTTGKCVHEVRAPVEWDKGSGIGWLIEHLRIGHARVLYLGDDVTDEDGFRVVNALQGLSVFVGGARQKTRAHWRVEDPAEVQKLLGKIYQALGASHGR